MKHPEAASDPVINQLQTHSKGDFEKPELLPGDILQ